MKILIVEDEALLAMSYKMALNGKDCQVVGIADSSEEALKLVRELTPDVVLMDIKLKGTIDGIETAKTIMQTSSAQIIYITGNTDEHTKERALRTKPKAYMGKPIDCAKLFKLLCASKQQ